MDIGKPPPLDPSRAPTPLKPATGAEGVPSGMAAGGAGGTGVAPAKPPIASTLAPMLSPSLTDLLDIHPLDLGAALRIAVSEVRVTLGLPLSLPTAQSVTQAAAQVLLSFLQGEAGAPPPPGPAPSRSPVATLPTLFISQPPAPLPVATLPAPTLPGMQPPLVEPALATSGTQPSPAASLSQVSPPLPAQVSSAAPVPPPQVPPPQVPSPRSPPPLAHAMSNPATPAAVWLAAAAQREASVHAALDRAVDTISAWRNVPHSVVEAAQQLRDQTIALFLDEPTSPLWFQVEWLALAPRMRRYWRRRRRLRRVVPPVEDARFDQRHPGTTRE